MSTVGGLAIAPEPSLRRRVGISARPGDLEGLIFFNSFLTNSSLIENSLKTWRALGERPGHEASSDFFDYCAEVMCKTPCDLPRLMSKASGSSKQPIFEHFVLAEMVEMADSDKTSCSVSESSVS